MKKNQKNQKNQKNRPPKKQNQKNRKKTKKTKRFFWTYISNYGSGRFQQLSYKSRPRFGSGGQRIDPQRQCPLQRNFLDRRILEKR